MAEDIGNLVIKVAMENSSFQEGMQNLNRTIRGATAEFKNSIAGLDGYGRGLDGLKSKSEMLSKQVDSQSKIVQMNKDRFNESKKTLDDTTKSQVELKSKVDEARKAYEDSIKATGENSKETKALKEELDKLTTEYGENEEKIRNNVRTMENWETKANNAETRLKGMEKELQSTNAEIEKQSSNWHKLSERLDPVAKGFKNISDKAGALGKSFSTKLTLPILGIATASSKLGMDFEASMSQVQAMSGATGEEMVRLEKAARDAGSATSKSAKDAADGLNYMALAGWDVNKSIDGLMPILRLSEAGNIDLARASSLVTDSMSAMGIEVNDLEGYLDVIAQTARSSNTDIDQMAEAYLGVGGVLRGLNIPLEESALALGFLANAGIKGSEAGTSLNKILLNLTAPAGKAKEALKKLGYSAFDNKGNFKGLEKVLFDVKEMTKDMTTEQQNQYLSMIAGAEHIDGMNALLNGLDDSYDSLKGSIAGADGALNEIAETMMDNNKGSIIELMSALEELGLKVYDMLKPKIESVTKTIQGLVDKLNALTPAQQENILKWGGLLAIIGPVLFAFSKVTGIISSVIGVVGTFSGAMAVVTTGAVASTPVIGGLATVFGALAGPVGIAIGVIGTVGLVTHELVKQFSEASLSVEEFGDEVSDTTAEAVNDFLELENGATTALNELNWSDQEITEDMAKNITDNFDGMSNQIINSAKEQKEKTLEELQSLSDGSSNLTEEQQKRIKEKLTVGYDEQIKKVEEGNTRIKEITELALKEERKLYWTEQEEIKRIKESMKEDAIKILSESEVEQLAIMERLKSESGKISAIQAAETVKNSLEKMEHTKAIAEKEYDEQMKIAARLRQDGTAESEMYADLVVAEAERKRKETVDNAERMHEEVIDEAKKQAKEHVNEVEWTTGEIKSKWAVMIDNAKESWKEHGEVISKEIDRSKKGLKEDLENIVSFFSTSYNKIKNNAKESFQEQGRAISEETKRSEEGLKQDWANIMNFFGGLPEKLKKIGSDMFKYLADGIESRKALVSSKAEEIGTKLKTGFKDKVSDAKEWGKNIMDGIGEGLESKKKWLVGKMEGIGTSISNGFKRVMEIFSPSRVFRRHGQNLMEGTALGIEDNLYKVEDAMDLATKVINEAGIEEGIKRLSISTDDYNEKLLNQATIVEIQKRHIEQLSKEHNKLAKSNKASTEEIEKSKKALESAKTELIKYEKAVDESSKKIIENYKKMAEELKKSQIDAINDLTNRVKTALKKRYEDEYKLQEKAIKKDLENLNDWKGKSIDDINEVYEAKKKRNQEEITELDRWRSRNLDSINEVYNTKLERINETSNAQIKALQDEIDSLDKAEQAKSREEEDSEMLSRINRLKSAIEYEHDEFNKVELQKQLNKEIKDREEKLRKWQVEDTKESLNQQMVSIREKAEAEKALLEQEKNDEIARVNSIYEHRKETLEREKEMMEVRHKEETERINVMYEFEKKDLERKLEGYKTFLEQKTEDAKLQAEAEKMIMDNNQKEIIELLHSYEESYKQAGQSLGDKLVEGFRPAIEEIMDMIDSVNKSLSRARDRTLGGISEMSRSSSGGSSNYTTNNNSNSRVVNNNVNINSPRALNHAEVNRQTKTTLRRMALA